MALVAECVGLDIGQTAFKAVRYRRSLSGRESVHYFYALLPPIPPGDLHPAHRVALLRSFLWEHDLCLSDRVVTAVPCQELFMRTLTLPFRDAGTLSEVVPFEVENLIPMPLEDVAVGSLILPPALSASRSSGDRTADVLAIAVPKQALTEHVKFLTEAGLNPAAINIDGLALYSVTEHLKQDGADVPSDLAVIDIGASKTTVCVIRDGRPSMLRTIPRGGHELTEALARRHGWSWGEAERRKRVMAAQQVDTQLEPLLRELRVTLHAYQSAAQNTITHCWVTGGGAKLRGLNGLVAHHLQLRAVGPQEGFGEDCPRAFSIAFGLALHPKIVRPAWRRGASRASLAVDLQQIAAAPREQTLRGRRDRKWAAIGALILCLLACTDLVVRVSLREGRVKALRGFAQSQFQEIFGGTVAPGDELEQAQLRVGSITKTLSLVDGAPIRALPLLAQVVTQLSRTVPVKIRDLTLANDRVQLEAETSSFEALDRVKQAFLAASLFTDVAVSESHVGTASNQVVFRLTMAVQAP